MVLSNLELFFTVREKVFNNFKTGNEIKTGNRIRTGNRT